jgi:hypothetical protein
MPIISAGNSADGRATDAPNVRMFDGGFPTDFLLALNEIAIAQIALASGGSPIAVTDIRLLRDQQTLLSYDDLRYCI